ncbi:MAG: SIS domain-containing protein [Mailhella sp.]|nr:SIS domain-containing protein [Mailhella sp.]
MITSSDAAFEDFRDLLLRYPALAECAQSIRDAYDLFAASYEAGGKLIIAGNGGSAADAEHIVGELMKSFRRKRPLEEALAARMQAIDPGLGGELAKGLETPLAAVQLCGNESLSTAFANDVNGQFGFAQQLLGYARPEDVFLAITTSGNSRNILYAAVAARALGVKVVALTGRGGGAVAALSDVCVRVPEAETFKIQELHLRIYHPWCMMLESRFFA